MKQRKTKTLKIRLSEEDKKKVGEFCQLHGITMTEFFDRAVFKTLFEIALLEPEKERLAIIKRLVGKDADLDYYEARMNAIMVLKGINVRHK